MLVYSLHKRSKNRAVRMTSAEIKTGRPSITPKTLIVVSMSLSNKICLTRSSRILKYNCRAALARHSLELTRLSASNARSYFV